MIPKFFLRAWTKSSGSKFPGEKIRQSPRWEGSKSNACLPYGKDILSIGQCSMFKSFRALRTAVVYIRETSEMMSGSSWFSREFIDSEPCVMNFFTIAGLSIKMAFTFLLSLRAI